LGRLKVLAHGYRCGRALSACRSVTKAQVEPHRVETGLEYDERMAPLRDVALGEHDECCADALACGRGRDVEAFDGVGGSMKPADKLRAEPSDPHLILRDRLLHAWNAAALCPGRCLALGQMRQREPADSRLPNVIEACDIGRIGEPKVQRRVRPCSVQQVEHGVRRHFGREERERYEGLPS